MNKREAVVDLLLDSRNDLFPDWGESLEDRQRAREIINFVLDNIDPGERGIHEGVGWPGSIDWDNVAAMDGDYLGLVGSLSVDGASVKVEVTIGENDVNYRTHVFTPDGDGGFAILAGRLRGIGRCLVVAFDHER